MITSTTRTKRPPRSPRSAASARRPAQRVAHLAHLDLDALRGYRQELVEEEARVSYWRRILQARMDTLARESVVSSAARARGRSERDEREGNGVLGTRLRHVLTRHQESSRRLAVLSIHDAAATPPLPDLDVLWESGPDADPLLCARLAAAEAELSAYRHSLHERIDTTTGELIARYREEPVLALRALPVPGRGNVA